MLCAHHYRHGLVSTVLFTCFFFFFFFFARTRCAARLARTRANSLRAPPSLNASAACAQRRALARVAPCLRAVRHWAAAPLRFAPQSLRNTHTLSLRLFARHFHLAPRCHCAHAVAPSARTCLHAPPTRSLLLPLRRHGAACALLHCCTHLASGSGCSCLHPWSHYLMDLFPCPHTGHALCGLPTGPPALPPYPSLPFPPFLPPALPVLP